MKILVFSDAHGNERKMREAIEEHKNAAMAVFLGDGIRQADNVFSDYPSLITMSVAGNCDGMNFISNTANTASFEEEGIRVFLCHGHSFHVKHTLSALEEYAREKGINLALYGHTHIPLETRCEGGIVLFNPGSIAEGSYGIVDLWHGGILCSHGRI